MTMPTMATTKPDTHNVSCVANEVRIFCSGLITFICLLSILVFSLRMLFRLQVGGADAELVLETLRKVGWSRKAYIVGYLRDILSRRQQ